MAPPTLTLRREAFEVGLLPMHQLFPRLDPVASLQGLAEALLAVSVSRPSAQLPDRRVVTCDQVAACLGAPASHAALLIDTLLSMTPPSLGEEEAATCHSQGNNGTEVDVYLLMVMLLMQAYQRPTPRVTGDVWPCAADGHPGSPTTSVEGSPTKANVSITAARKTSGDESSQLAYLQKNMATLLGMLKDSDRKGAVTPARFDRLGLVLEAAGRPLHTPLSAVASHLFPHAASSAATGAELAAVQRWLTGNTGLPPAAARLGSGAALAAMAAGAGAAGREAAVHLHVEGMCKTTVVQREAELGVAAVVRVADCQDAVVYLLAAMQHVSVVGCVDCIVVLGAVAGTVKVELCERVHVVSASRRLRALSCHDSLFCLAVNQPPVVIGDCRRLQLAPYNTYYERLDMHLQVAGVKTAPNCWDSPLNLCATPRHTPSPSSSDPTIPSQEASKLVVSLLAPERFLPFMVPFRVPAGGAAAAESGRPSYRPTQTNPFTMPQAYASALAQKVQTVEDMRRMVVKEAGLDSTTKIDLQTVIQTYFKEWLVASGNIRQVHDLIRMERDES